MNRCFQNCTRVCYSSYWVWGSGSRPVRVSARVKDGSGVSGATPKVFSRARARASGFSGVHFLGPQLLTSPCASPPQLTVYLGKRDFVDHIDLVDPVGESLEAREEGSGGGGAGQAPSREGVLKQPRNSPRASGAKNGM